MSSSVKKILLAPLDPVHDVGIRLIGKGLEENGYEIVTMPPDITVDEVVSRTEEEKPSVVLVSRTIGYQVEETLAKLVDMMDAAGLRDEVRIGLGGMAVKPELAQELGCDAGFGPETVLEEVIAFIEGKTYRGEKKERAQKVKIDETENYDYSYVDPYVGEILDEIAAQAIEWGAGRTSPGVNRARLREEIVLTERSIESGDLSESAGQRLLEELRKEYAGNCDENIARYYTEGVLPSNVRELTGEEFDGINEFCDYETDFLNIQHIKQQPRIYVQYGTGCPVMDIAHIKVAEAWGADGILHFDPSWEARSEGLLEGCLTHEDNGTLYSPEIASLIKANINKNTMWTLRAHRGLNTAETVVLAGLYGADQVKMNPVYGSISGGNDPERIMVDALECIRYAVKFGLSYDIPVGQELSGVPSHKTMANILIIAAIGKKLGAKSILNPLFCYSPHVMLNGMMDNNYVDYNAARVRALRSVINAPVRAGEPVAFMTHTEERVQSAVTTALHTVLGASLGIDAVTIASTDEAYSGGPITVTSRIDTLMAVKEAFRFFGDAYIQPSSQADKLTAELVENIVDTLKKVRDRGDFVQSIYEGLLGDKEDGVYPGRAGKDTVTVK